MTTRTISVEALALHNQHLAKANDQRALLLQEDLLVANKMITQLQAELEHYKAELAKLKPEEGENNGTAS